MQDEGSFEHGVAHSSLHILPGSGLDELTGIEGSGMYRAGKEGVTFELDYSI